MKWIVVVFFLPLFVFSQECDSVPPLNQEIIGLAKSQMKKKVGTGECWDLAEYVLDETNAEWDRYEVYGILIDHTNDCIFPGDIIQFEKVKLAWKEDGVSYQEAMEHHTAIVSEVKDATTLILIHQNTGMHGKKVGETVFHMDAIKKGKILVYRPQASN